jgi:hypothetical protein
MCLPVAALLAANLAVSAAAGIASVQGQAAQASAQKNYQQQLVAANNAQAYEQSSSLRIQQAQDSESRARENEKARLATQKAVSTSTVAAGEAGLTGASVDALLGEYQASLGQYRETTLRQGQLYASGVGSQIDALRAGNGMSNLQINAPIARPNYTAAVLNFGSDALGAYRAYNPNAFQKSSNVGTNPNYFGGAARGAAYGV